MLKYVWAFVWFVTADKPSTAVVNNMLRVISERDFRMMDVR